MTVNHNDLKPSTVITLSPRLEAVVQMLPACHTVADIGCDHGKLSANLLLRRICKRVIAIDVSVPSLNKAQKLAIRLNLQEKMSVREGSGLSILSYAEAQCAVFAGMGGFLIAQLLKEDENTARSLSAIILQPMQHVRELRQYLRDNMWRICDEQLVQEGSRIYEMIRIESGEPDYQEDLDLSLQDELGPIIWRKRHPLIKKKLEQQVNLVRKQICNVRLGGTEHAMQVASQLYARERALLTVLAQYQNNC